MIATGAAHWEHVFLFTFLSYTINFRTSLEGDNLYNGKTTQVRSEQCSLGKPHFPHGHAGDHAIGAAGFYLEIWR